MKAIIKTKDGRELEINLSCEQEQQIKELCNNEFDIDYENNGYTFDSTGLPFSSECISYDRKKNGRYRKTKEHCEEATILNQQVNRLDELAKWLEPDWKADWDDNTQQKYHLYYSYSCNSFYMNYGYTKTVGAVYMSGSTARKIRNALNEGKLPELYDILKR